MIVSETPQRLNSRSLQACVLLCAIVMLPFGMAYAQDYDAVEKRLEKAVKKGQLTHEQAEVMMHALRRTSQKDQDLDKGRAYVEAGKISAEDVAKRYKRAAKAIQEREKAIQKRMAAGRTQRSAKRITREDLSRAGIRIRKAVADGKISAEEGRAKMAAMRKMLGEQREDAAKKRDTGKITREEVGMRLRKAVAEGKISEEDARARLEAMRQALAERRGDERSDWEGIKKRIEGAVERGDMTREEADAKYKEIKKRMGKRRGETRSDWDGIKKRIEGAVDRGDLTREEADAKYRELKKRKK